MNDNLPENIIEFEKAVSL